VVPPIYCIFAALLSGDNGTDCGRIKDWSL